MFNKLAIIKMVAFGGILAVDGRTFHLLGPIAPPQYPQIGYIKGHFQALTAVPFPILAALAGKTTCANRVKEFSHAVIKVICHAFLMTAGIASLLF